MNENLLVTKDIDKVISNFFKKHNFPYTVCIDTDFAFYYESNLLTYSLVVSEKMDKMFMDFALSNGLKYDCGIFILSLMHEVGHDMVYATYSADDLVKYAESESRKDNLTSASDEEILEYFNLFSEKSATLWAINFLNNHYEEIKIFAQDLQKEINNFYENYEITIE